MSKAATMSSVPVRALMKMTGMSQVDGCAFRRRQTSMPSMPGRTMSSRIRSGRARWAIASARSPLFATKVW